MHNKIRLPHFELSMLREVLPFLKTDDKKEVWLTGGSVRDLVMGKKKIYDLDLAVNFDPVEPAQMFAKKKNLGFVILDDERKVTRIVKKRGSDLLTIDITRFRACNIDEDLKKRDVTINAIAARLDFQQADLELYDPLNGIEHINNKILYPCSEDVMTDDPLRIMRAFRFAASLDFELSGDLSNQITQHAKLLKNVSGERIRDELFKILKTPASAAWINKLNQTSVLKTIMPELSNCKGTTQNEWHHLDVYDHSLLTLENLEKLILNPLEAEWWSRLTKYLDEKITEERTYLQLLKLACLLHDIGKPECRKKDADKDKIIFHGHEMLGVNLSENVCERLRLSTGETRFLKSVVKNHMRPGVMVQQGLNDKLLFRFFTETGRDGVGIALLSLSDRLAALGDCCKKNLKSFTEGIIKIIESFYTQLDKPPVIPLINGQDLIKELDLKPGPIFKQILQTVNEARHVGEIKNKQEALELAKIIALEQDTK